MDYAIVNATEEDREELLSLYHVQLGRECCPWDEEYPGEESIDWDLSRNALFVMKTEGKILAAISFEEDEEVDAFPFWDRGLEPSGELARLAVLPEWQNRGVSAVYYKDMSAKAKKIGNVHAITNPQIETNSAVNIWSSYDNKPFMRRRCYVKTIE